MVGLCSRKVGPRVEGVAGVGAAFSQQGGLRGPQEVWSHGVSAMSYVPFTRTWGVIASVSWTRKLTSMRDEVPTGRSKGGLDAQAQADLSYHLPSWTIVDQRVRYL